MGNIYSKIRRTVVNESDMDKVEKLLLEDEPDLRYYDPYRGSLKLDKLCNRDIDLGQTDSNYCKLYQVSQNLDSGLRERMDKDLSEIYDFLRTDVRDNRRKFHSMLELILQHENPANSLHLLSDYIKKTDNNDEINRMIDRFRRGRISSSGLDNFLKQAKFSEYTKYENSFVGDHFKRNPTSLRLEYRINRNDKNLIDRIIDILDGKTKVSSVVGEMYENIINNYKPENMVKGDLVCTKTVLDLNGKPIINNGEVVEVKKLDYQADSYLSEFLAIYKNRRVPKISKTPDFINVYNKIIDELYKLLSSTNKNMLDDIKTGFAGIVYDGNYFIKKDDIDFYWSNKGRSTCSEHRLSIRYKINKTDVDGYIFKPETGILEPIKLTIRTKEDYIFCPVNR